MPEMVIMSDDSTMREFHELYSLPEQWESFKEGFRCGMCGAVVLVRHFANTVETLKRHTCNRTGGGK